MRRGLDRIGIVNLGQGHADITAMPAPDDDERAPDDKRPVPVLTYIATLPYAEMRTDFGYKKSIVAVVGKRCAISGVPPFLDVALKPWRDKLREAAQGRGAIDAAFEGRAIRECFELMAAGRGQIAEARKLYPFGLSLDVIKSIYLDLRQYLHQSTLRLRSATAAASVVVVGIFFYGLVATGFVSQLAAAHGAILEAFADLSVLGFGLAGGWGALNFVTRFFLIRRFPTIKFGLTQKIGWIGQVMLASIVLLFVLCLWLAPVAPSWMLGSKP